MYYRLTHVGDRPVPAATTWGGRPVTLAAGGLLLDPAGLRAVARLEWAGDVRLAEAVPYGTDGRYRWPEAARLEIGADPVFLAATAEPDRSRLTAVLPGARLPRAAVLRFEAAPDDPIDPWWIDAVAAPDLEATVPVAEPGALVRGLVDALNLWLRATRPLRAWRGRRRVAAAWRAPA